jgi:lysozyme family protein
MKINFERALKNVLVHEGDWSESPKDPGGVIMKGVTLTTYRRHFGKDKSKDELRNISDKELKKIYRSDYWNRCHCDKLPTGVDYVVFDAAVNSGPERGVKWLQEAVGEEQDGLLGARTLFRVKEHDPINVAKVMCDIRLSFLHSLSTWPTFGKGWELRIENVRATAIAMIEENSLNIEKTSSSVASETVENVTVKKGPVVTKDKASSKSGDGGDFVEHTINYWIFQATLRRYDLSRQLQLGEKISWLASRYRGKMKKDDVVYFWQSGANAALHGQGRIISDSSYETSDGWRIDVECNARLDIPLSKKKIIEDEVLRDMQIIKAPQGTNFSVNSEQVEALRKVFEFVSTEKQNFFLTNKAIEDVWTLNDKLGYRLYAQAIAIPILEGRTKPPITIAIQAPWGHGKTSLMRMIQQQFDPQAVKMENEQTDVVKEDGWTAPQYTLQGFQEKFKAVLKKLQSFWLKGDQSVKKNEAEANFGDFFTWLKEKTRVTNMLEIKGDEIPTIWFNPLYYQEKEQVWAGMAHCMLTQLTARFKTKRKREEFWLRLQMHRLNTTAILRDFKRMLLEDFIPRGLMYGFAALGLGIIGALSSANALFSLSLFSAPLLVAATHFNKFFTDAKTKPLHGKFEKYVSEPNYSDRLGFLYLVDNDIKSALELLTGDKPVAVFIDDLDRCSPDVVCEVILAINQFISLRGRNVIFILGMDTNMVAMALESVHSYAQDHSKTDDGRNVSRVGKNFGWQFMDKFIQVPFTIPRLSQAKAKKFMIGLLSEEKPEKGKKQTDFDMEAYKKQYQEIKSGEDIVELKKQLEDEAPEKNREQLLSKLSAKASRIISDPVGEETEKLVELALKNLHFKPRAMKRFLNVVRLLRHIDMFYNSRGNVDFSRLLVVRTAQLTLNWPQFVRWLQDADNWGDIGHKNRSPIEKIEKVAKIAKDFKQWEKNIVQHWPQRNETPFLFEYQFFSFIKRITDDTPGLSEIREAGFI